MGYPVVSKEYFYSRFDREKYKYINNCYRESDDSILLYRDEILRDRTMIFQLVDLNANEVPDNRKNLYIIPLDNLDELRIEMYENEYKTNKRVSAQLLVKFLDPYSTKDIESYLISKKDINWINNIALEANFCPIITKTFEYLVESINNPDNEYKNLNKAKDFIDKKLYELKKAK